MGQLSGACMPDWVERPPKPGWDDGESSDTTMPLESEAQRLEALATLGCLFKSIPETLVRLVEVTQRTFKAECAVITLVGISQSQHNLSCGQEPPLHTHPLAFMPIAFQTHGGALPFPAALSLSPSGAPRQPSRRPPISRRCLLLCPSCPKRALVLIRL